MLLRDHGATEEEGHHDASMHAIIDEADKWAHTIAERGLRDAGLIASLQRMEHDEIAVPGTLASWAGKLGHDRDASVLTAILDEDRFADARLTVIAEEDVNPAAL